MCLTLSRMPQFSFIKIFAATTVEIIVLSSIYFYSFYYRFSRLHQGSFDICLNDSLQKMRACANRMMFYYLTEPSWIAIQFTLLVIPAAIIVYLFCYMIWYDRTNNNSNPTSF